MLSRKESVIACVIQHHLIIILTIFVYTPMVYANTYNYSNELSEGTQIAPIIVTATRIPVERSRIAENVVIFTEDDIKNLPARNLSEVLAYIPGVDISVNNKFGQSTSLSIHGSDSRHVLLMVDDIPFNHQLSGQANPTRIPVENILRIEIIKGAASSAWGSSIGGVINVITKETGQSDTPTGNFTSSFAEFSTTKNSLDLSGRLTEELSYFVSGSYMETDGTHSASNVKENKAFVKLKYLLNDNARLTTSFGYSGANVHDGVRPNNTRTEAPYNSRYGKIILNIDQDNFTGNIAYKYNDQDVLASTYNATTGALIGSSVSNTTYQGLSLNSYYSFREDDVLVVGADFDWHTLKAGLYMDRSKRISMQAPYINYSMKLDQWHLTTGLRYDRNQRFGSQTSPSLGIVYHFMDSRKSLIRAKVSRAFNAPPLLWIYNDAPSQWVAPNENLKAERSNIYEIGMATKLFERLDLDFNIYRADVKDAIGLVVDPSTFIATRNNFKKFRRQGAELSLTYAVTERLSLFSSGTFTDVENRATRKKYRDSGIARQSLTIGGNYENQHGFNFNLRGYYKRWSSTVSQQPNDRKFIFDAKFIQNLKDIRQDIDLELFLNIYNLTNSKYWASITYPLPKRYFEGGFSLKF